MKKTIIIIFLAFMLMTLDSSAQLEIHNIDRQSSFKGEYIKNIFIDSNGDLWFGDITGNGVMKFDGDVWKNYTSFNGLPDIVTAIAEDHQGNMWFGAVDGAYRFDGISSVTKFTTSDGLPENEIRDLLVDHNGDLWFATFSGLTRYDGSTWTTYTTSDGLVSNFLSTLFEDNMNRLWIGTYEGVSKIEGTFVNYTTADGLPHDIVYSITQSHDSLLWFGTGDGAASYNETGFTVYTTADGLSSNSISDIMEDSKGNMWFTSYTANGGLTKYDRLVWPTYTTEHGLISNYTACVAEDDEGNIWIGTAKGISKLQPESWQYISILDGLAGMVVLDILGDDSGNKWFATYSGLSKMSDTIVNYTTANGLPDNRCYAVNRDTEGNIWLGTLSGAVHILEDTLFIYNTDSGLVNNNIVDIEIAPDATWFTTMGGVSKWSGGQWTNYTTAQGLGSNLNFCSLLDETGKLWVGSLDNGVSRFDGTLWTHYHTGNGFLNNSVWDIFEDREGNIWFATGGGIAKYDGSIWETITKADGLTTDTIRSIFQDDYDNMWFGTDSSEIVIFNDSILTVYTAAHKIPDINTWVIKEINDTMYAGGDLGIVSYSYKTAWTNYLKSSMPSDTIQTIMTDIDDHLWLGTWGRGLARYNGINWYHIDQAGGLSGNNVYDLTQDQEGNIWVATSSGGITKISESSIETYTTADGLVGTGWYSIAADKDTNIWIGSNAGLNLYDGTTFSNFTTTDGLPSNHVTAILPRDNGDLWIGTVTGNGAAKFDGDSWEVYSTAEGLVNNNVNDIIEDSEGNLWFATNAGISRYNGNNWINYTSSKYFGNSSIWSLLEDKVGNIWAFTWGNGAYIFNLRYWSRLQQSDGIAGNDIRDATMENDGKIWLATYGNGISSIYRDIIKIDSVVKSPNICHNDSTGKVQIYAQPAEKVMYTIDFETYQSSGLFDSLVAGIVYAPVITNGFDSIFHAKFIFQNPDPLIVELGNDTTICAGNDITLSAPLSWWYEWSNGVSGDRQIIVSDAGTYSVIVSDENGCKGSDTIALAVKELPVVNLGNDTTICEGARLLLTAPLASSYQWSNSSSSQQIVVNEAAAYSVTVSDAYGCEGSDTVAVAFQSLPVVNLGEDISLEPTENITLDAGPGFVTYMWSTGTANQTFPVNGASLTGDTLFWVSVTDNFGCQGGDTIFITYVIIEKNTDQINHNPVLIYPNPANHKIFIICEAGFEFDYLALFDETGKPVKSLTVCDQMTNYEIDMTEIPAGKYILMIRSAGQILTKILIKK
ncbi:MAG: T9SS type A sorting domain-containing protein [Bacteroidales bacterium]|nr:T9SS type A sorting domain-containing protein [Bacteroidales bacterium]